MSANQGIFGYFAGMASAAFLQPLQNIKMAIILPPSKLNLSSNFAVNLMITFKYIYKEGGIRQFYDGMIPNVLKNGTGSAVYFYTMRKLENSCPQKSAATNFAASACGRVASSLISNPLAVLQTRYELAGEAKWQGSITHSLKRVYANEGVSGFYKGGLASCYKQGSFAGLYYMLYVAGKNYGLNSLISGLGSGLISTAITHPFQIIRASLQCNCDRMVMRQGIVCQLSQLVRKKEVLKGVAPRLVKKPIANTMAFIIFQTMENIDKSSDA